jgi:hypothetical protein
MKKFLTILILFVSLGSCAEDFPKIPNESISPGHLCSLEDKDFYELRYKESIPYCKRNVSTFLKNRIYFIYNISEDKRKDYTIDHIIPLSIGGSNDPKNLWPEHYLVKNTRRNLEYQTYINLKNGKINQSEAINIIIKEKFKN